MANLSNINNILRTSSLGVGINCDAEFSLDIEKASANAILSLNSNGGSGAEYLLSSTTSGEFVLNKRYVGDRLTISSGGDATFAGDITLDDDLNFSTNGFADISNTGTGAMRFKPSGQTLALTLTGANATFAGTVDVNGTLKLDTNGILQFGANTATPSMGVAIHRSAADTLNFVTASTNRLTIDSDGNVGIGTDTITNPYSQTPFTDLNIDGTWGGVISFKLGGTEKGWIGQRSSGNADMVLGASSGQDLLFYSNGTNERMRISNLGPVLIGKTDTNIDVGNGHRFDSDGAYYASIVNAENALYVRDITNSLYRFYVTGSGQINATSTSISAISDITLKENIKPLETGLNEVMNLKPRRFDWKNGDGENIAGFIAQEVEEVLPDLVGDYEYDDEETKKALKMGDMIPTLVNAIQELKAEIEILKNK